MVRTSYDCASDGRRVTVKRTNGFPALDISFHRTIRVPDNGNSNHLPPSLGTFPLYKTNDYVNKLPKAMAAKGGVFLPMYRESLYKYPWG